MNLDELLAQQQAEEAASQPQAISLDQMLEQQQAEERAPAEEVGRKYERAFKAGPLQNALTAFSSGGAELARIGDNLKDMVGLMPPEEVTARDQARQQELDMNTNVDMDSGYATSGKIGADVAAAIPTAALATKLGAAAIPAVAMKYLPQAGTKLAGLAGALFEGGVVGATQSEAGNRGVNTAQAGATNAIVDTALRSLSRGTIRGIGNESKEAKKLLDQAEFKTGERPFLPMQQSIDPKSTGIGDTLAKAGAYVASVLPKAKATFTKQADEGAQAINKGILQTRFAGKDRGATVGKVLDETGDVGKAIDASRRTLKQGTRTPYSSLEQAAIAAAAKKAPQGRFTPDQLATASRKVKADDDAARGVYEVSGAPLEDTITSLQKTVGQPVSVTDLATRTFFQGVTNAVGNVARVIPGASLLASTVSTKGFQNFIMGNTGAQKTLQNLMKKGDDAGVVEALKGFVKAYSADSSNDQAMDQRDGVLNQSLTAASNVKNRVGL